MNATTHSLRPLAMDINCSLFPSELLGIEFNMSSAYNRSCMDTVDRPDGPLDHFREFYLVIHGYLSLAVCVFGIIANIANIIVLTRKEMASATNAILTGLAAADMLVMVDYVPFAAHNYCSSDKRLSVMYSHGWAVFTLFHAHFSVVCHTISTWLTVLLAVWRYIAVSFPTESKLWCSMRRTAWAIFGTYVSVMICCIPVYLSFTISAEDRGEDGIIYRVDWSHIAIEYDILKKINFWVFSCGTKLVPCFLLTYLSLTLIRALMEADRRKQRLKCGPTPSPRTSSAAVAGNCITKATPPTGHSNQSDRTTKMLLAILLLFLFTEFPSGILVLLSGIIGDKFFQSVYTPLGELLDILALLNSAINFILYCSMSTVFRNTFVKLFCLKCVRNNGGDESERPAEQSRVGARCQQLTTQPSVNMNTSEHVAKTTSIRLRSELSSNVTPTPV